MLRWSCALAIVLLALACGAESAPPPTQSPAPATAQPVAASPASEVPSQTPEPPAPEITVEVGAARLEVAVPPALVTAELQAAGRLDALPAVNALYAANARHPLFLNPHYGSGPVTRFLQFVLATHDLGLDPFTFGLEEILRRTDGACVVRFAREGEAVPELEDSLARFVEPVPPPLFQVGCAPDWWPGDAQAAALDVRLALAYTDLYGVLAPRPLLPAAAPPFAGAEAAVPTLVALLPPNERFARRVAALRRFLPYHVQANFPVLGRWGPLKPGDFGPRVARLKRRLLAENYLPPADAKGRMKRFDRATRQAVVDYRQAYGLLLKSHVDHAMLDILAQDADSYVQRLWRSLHRTLVERREREANYLLVNIPEFTTYLVRDGRVARTHRSIVGFPYEEPGGRTPEVSARVAYVDLNPTWTPTPYVVEHELRPKARRHPSFFRKNHFEERNGKLVQAPGPHNTLGQVVIGFENDNNISLHGTPDAKPFGYADRALSHGCVRVEGIEALAADLLGFEGATLDPPLDTILDRVVERRVDLTRDLPVHIIYDRVRVVDDDSVAIARDPYKLERRLASSDLRSPVKRLVALGKSHNSLAAAD